MLPVPSLNLLTHPEGESPQSSSDGRNDTFPVQTAGGIFHVRWDPTAQVSASGGIVHFAQFLDAAQVFDQWVEDCPLSYASNHAHRLRDILGTWMLSTLNGHRRYAHITALRGDTVSPALLRMRKVVSEDSVRRALKRMDAEASRTWAQRHLLCTLAPLLSLDWILDVDVTIKPLYGYQEGSVVGYNPHKPGRPSHAYHTFLVAKARLVLDVEVHPGDEHSSATTKIGLFNWLEKIPRSLWPKLLRGDSGFGTEDMMAWPEAEGLHYLFKQRMTKKTRDLVHALDLGQEWIDAGQGWHGIDSTLRLTTWTKQRRVVVLRRPRQQRYPRRKDIEAARQPKQLIIDEVAEQLVDKDFEYQVLVTSRSDHIAAIAQLYRDRADAENVFDELKNQWGWGGFTTTDLDTCQIAARMTAQVYNWWSIFVRLASPDHHREAVTSRPLLFASVARLTTSGGQRFLTISSVHAAKTQVAEFFTKLAGHLAHFTATAEQWTREQRWQHLIQAIFAGPFGTVKPTTG